MNVVGKVGSLISQGVYSVATPFHPFGGAVDVIVVQHEDGTYRSTPWYVRFGKFQGVLKGAEKVVSISVNGVEAPFHMYLDNSGQAYFMREVVPGPESGSEPQPEYVCTDSIKEGWGSESSRFQEEVDQVMEESKQTDSSGLNQGGTDEQSYSFQMSQSSSSYQFGSLEEVEERVKESNGSNSEVVLVSIDGHILTAPLNSTEEASDNLELDHPQFHLGPGESTSGDFGGNSDVWENGIFDLDVSGNKTESAKENREVVVGELTTVTQETTGLSLDKVEQFKSCIDLTAQLEDADSGENSPIMDTNDVKSKEKDICNSECCKDSSVSSQEKQGIDDSGVGLVGNESDTATLESRSQENPEAEKTPENEFTEKNLETGFTREHLDMVVTQEEHHYPVTTGNSETENSASGLTEDPRNEEELNPENEVTEKNPETGFTGEHLDTLAIQVGHHSPVATGNDETENSASGLTEGTGNEEEPDPENEVTEKNLETGFTEERLDNLVTQEEHHSPVSTGIDETENSASGLTEGTGNEEELDQTSHTESPKFSGLGCEISTCGNILRPGIGRISAEEIFKAHRISEEEFRSSGPSIIKNSNLIVKIDNNYFPWNKAAHIVLGRAVYGPKFSLELKDAIPVEEREDTIGISPSFSRRWRLWPIPFRMARSLQRTDSTSSADELFLDSESFLQSPTDDKPSEFGSGNANSSNNKNNSSISNNDNGASPTLRKQFVRTNTPTNEQIASLNLKEGQNMVSFSFSTRVLGRQEVDAHIYLWKWNARIVISDVDGTITKSDVLGQFMPLVGKDWTQSGVARLFCAIKENGYQLLFLSARAIVQAYLTRNFLLNLKQDGKALPSGPVVISPDGLFPSLYREVIRRAPHEFKIACLEDIKALFPSDYNPFYAGFGNRDTDELSYRKIGIPKGKIFIINPKGEVAINNCTDVKSYTSLHTLANDMFPPTSLVEQEDYNAWNYWKTPLPDID